MRFTLSGKACLAVLLFGGLFGWQYFALQLFHDSLRTNADPDAYAKIANHVARRHEFSLRPGVPTALRSPGYVLAIQHTRTWSKPYLGVLLVHSFSTLVILWSTYNLGSRLGAGRWAILAVILVAIDPVLIRQSALLMSETLFTALFALSLAAYVNVDRKPILSVLVSGLFIALAALTRPIAIAAWVLIGIVSMTSKRAKPWLIATAVGIFVYHPWPVRNLHVFGTPILTTTHGGYTLWLGMNPVYYREVVAGPHEIWPEPSFEEWTNQNIAATKGMNELQTDVYFRDKALDWMTSHPSETARSVLHHVWSLWTPMPHIGGIWQRRAVAAFHVVVYILATIGVVRGRAWRWPRSILLVCLLAFTLIHAVYWSNVRMRAPLAPVIATLASFAFLPRSGTAMNEADVSRSPPS